MKSCNKWIVKEMLNTMPDDKRATLVKALERNLYLTSSYVLSSCELTVYIEGWLLELEGTRSGFRLFAKDNDGELEFVRKPSEDKLHKLYSEWQPMNEADFYDFW